MGLRIHRSSNIENTNDVEVNNSLNIIATYDLDDLKNLNDRASSTEIAVNVSDTASDKENGLRIDSSKNKILMNNADAKKYLFKNESSSSAYTPTISLRRPIVFFEEKTPDQNMDSKYGTFSGRMEDLEKIVIFLDKEIKKIQEENIKKDEKINNLSLECASLSERISLLENNSSNDEITLLKNKVNILEKYHPGTFGIKYSNTVGYQSYGIAGYEGTDKNLVIPNFYLDKPIIRVDENAFEDSDIESVIFLDGSQSLSIREYAFNNCTSLKSIQLPSNLYEIENRAFRNCTNLKSIVIPLTCERISGELARYDAFEGCTSLTDIYIEGNEDRIPGAPWGAKNAQVHWNYEK